jgi:hypothetical protein
MSQSVLVGWRAGENLTRGSSQTFVGYSAGAGANNTTGNRNIHIGWYSGFPGGGLTAADGGVQPGQDATNNIVIGNNVGIINRGALVGDRSDQVIIGNNDSDYYYQWVAGWNAPSDERDKTQTASLDLGLDFINQLQIKQYKWNKRSKYTNPVSNDGTLSGSRYAWGVMAQNLVALTGSYSVLSDIINTVSGSYRDGTQYEMYTFNHDLMLWPAVKAIQEINAKAIYTSSLDKTLTIGGIRIQTASSSLFTVSGSGSIGNILAINSNNISGSISINGVINGDSFESTPSTTKYFYDRSQYEVQDFRHQFHYLSGEVSSSVTNTWIGAKTNVKIGSGIQYIKIPSNSTNSVKIKWVGRTDEVGNIVSVIREDIILIQKDGNVISNIADVNTIRLNDGIGFDANYAALDIGDGSGDGVTIQFRIGNFDGTPVDLVGRNFTLRTKAIVEFLSVDNL